MNQPLGSDTLAAAATVLALARLKRENFMMIAMCLGYEVDVRSFKDILIPLTIDHWIKSLRRLDG